MNWIRSLVGIKQINNNRMKNKFVVGWFLVLIFIGKYLKEVDSPSDNLYVTSSKSINDYFKEKSVKKAQQIVANQLTEKRKTPHEGLIKQFLLIIFRFVSLKQMLPNKPIHTKEVMFVN